MNTLSEDKRVIRNINAKIKRIIKNDLPKINNENAQFFLTQAFITVNTFLSSASSDLKTKPAEQSNEAISDDG